MLVTERAGRLRIVRNGVLDTEPMPTIDPTAELLGTSTRRKRPTRAAAAPTGRTARSGASKKPAPRKAAPRRPAR